MFGGHGLYLDGLFIGIIADETLYLKADELSQPAFRQPAWRPSPTAAAAGRWHFPSGRRPPTSSRIPRSSGAGRGKRCARQRVPAPRSCGARAGRRNSFPRRPDYGSGPRSGLELPRIFRGRVRHGRRGDTHRDRFHGRDRGARRRITGARRPSAPCRTSASAASACPLPLIHALGLLKQAAAETNMKLGALDRQDRQGHRRGRRGGRRRQARRGVPAGRSGRPAPAPRPT